MPSTPNLEIHLFGQFRIFINGRNLQEKEIKGRKARSLLKLIAHQRNFQIVRDKATDILWPDLDVNAANSQLYKALYHIRNTFEKHADGASDWIEITDNLIRINPPAGITTDVQQFEEIARTGLKNRNAEQLEKATSIYRGEFLPMDRYAEWASLPREHYHQVYLDILTALAETYEKQGELSEAAERLRHALEVDPTLEIAHRGLMRIFAGRGQASRAYHQYEVCRKTLGEELGVSPSAETTKVLNNIRDGHITQKTGARTGNVLSAKSVTKTPFIGRSDECATIDEKLGQVKEGQGGALIISGEAGIGKTRLIQKLASMAQQKDLSVFTGRTESTTGKIAYRSFISLFEDILHSHPELESDLPVEIGHLVPGYKGDGRPAPHADKLAARGYLFARIRNFISLLAKDEPRVIILEDLHEADNGSRELFSYLVQHSGQLPVLFAATLRKDESEPLPDYVSELQSPIVEYLELAPFSYEEHVNLLHLHTKNAVIGAETAGYIYQLAEGNPFYAIELLRHHTEDGEPIPKTGNGNDLIPSESSVSQRLPDTIRHMVQQKMENLSPQAYHLLYIAAVIGSQVPYEVLAAIWKKNNTDSEQDLFNALEEVIRAQILVERGLDYSFRHNLVREAIYASISGVRRRKLHRQAAGQLLEYYSDSDEIPIELVARHFVGAGELTEGARYLAEAGKKAENAYAHDDALRYLNEALELISHGNSEDNSLLKCKILEQSGDVYRACGRLEECYRVYGKAISIAENITDYPGLAELHRKMALAAIFQTDIERSKKHLDKAFDLTRHDQQLKARLLIVKALQLWHTNQLEEAYNVARKSLESAKDADAEAESSQACEILAMICLPLGKWEEGLKYEMERKVYGWSPDVVVATDAHLCLWEYHVSGDQPFQKARSFMNQVSEQATEAGDLRCVAVCHYALGTMYLWRGNRHQAVKELTSSLDLHEQVGSPAGMAYSLARKSVIHTMMGANELGWQAVQKGLKFARQAAVRDHCLQRLYGVGIWNRMEANDINIAGELVKKSEALLSDSGACGACALELYPWLAYYYLKTSQIDQARQCSEIVSELAQQTGNPIGKAISNIIKSGLSIGENDTDSAQEYIRISRSIIEETVPDTAHSPLTHYLNRMTDHPALPL